MARAIRCPGVSVPASTIAGPNPGGDAVAPLASAKRDIHACGRGGAQCGDDIDWECGRRRQWATFSARVKIPTISGPEQGLEMLTAVQWRQKLGLTDFRSDHVFLREVAVERMDEGVVQEWNSWVWAAETDRIEELIFYTDGAAQLIKPWPRRGCRRVWDLA